MATGCRLYQASVRAGCQSSALCTSSRARETFFDQVGSAQQGGSHVPVVGRVAAADPLQLPGCFHQPFHPHRVAIVQQCGRAEKIDSLEIQTLRDCCVLCPGLFASNRRHHKPAIRQATESRRRTEGPSSSATPGQFIASCVSPIKESLKFPCLVWRFFTHHSAFCFSWSTMSFC